MLWRTARVKPTKARYQPTERRLWVPCKSGGLPAVLTVLTAASLPASNRTDALL